MHRRDFSFPLPEALIAKEPAELRDSSRLLYVPSVDFSFRDLRFFDLPSLLRAGDVLVCNNTKVVPARLFALRGDVRIEVMLHLREASDSLDCSMWRAFVRPARKVREGDVLRFSDGVEAIIVERHGAEASLRFPIAPTDFFPWLAKIGILPLPPYLKREVTESDRERYQTVYAQSEGAVAAPTAGLHFTSDLFSKLDAMGVERCFVTLHVGAGTFVPVKVDAIADHVMHAEYGEISAGTAEKINCAKQEGRRVIAVGTTSVRLLESAANEGGLVRPFAQETSIFITPGYRFKIVDAMVTNFHLPESTLFMLVSAFSGLQRMQAAYAHAIKERYRFYSYGDACFLELCRGE